MTQCGSHSYATPVLFLIGRDRSRGTGDGNAGLKEAPERFREGAAKLAVAQSASIVGVSDGQKGRN